MLCAAAALAQAAAIADLPTTTIFTHGESPNCTCIRIPSLVLSNDTVLLAFAMCRQGTGDNCQPLRPAGVPAGATTTLIYKRSTDGGGTWGALTTVPGSEHDPNGGPRAVALRDSSTVLLTNSHGKLWRSDDRGLTWARPVEMFSPAQSLGGGGVMLELSTSHPTHPSRLVAAFDATLPFPACSPGGSPYDAACEYASSYWSDDGQAWTLSSSRVPKLDESEVLEMADGTLVMLSRNQDGSCAVDLERCKAHQDGGCMCVAHTVSTDAVSPCTAPSPAPRTERWPLVRRARHGATRASFCPHSGAPTVMAPRWRTTAHSSTRCRRTPARRACPTPCRKHARTRATAT